MAGSIVGRDAELAAISDFLSGTPDGAGALVLEGEAGMGKTTLWHAGVERALEGGIRALAARPAESESDLSFAALGDLLRPVLDDVLAALPGGQRAALSRALVLDEVEAAPPEPLAVGVALHGALQALARNGSVLVAVDDTQWLDAASGAALAYAARRLRDEPVGLLLARRSGLASSVVHELERSSRERIATIEVGPLDATALHQVVSDRLATTLPRPLMSEIQQASGGNPFYAIELVRTLQRRGGQVEAGRPLPVPDSLHELVNERLSALPEDSRVFLLAAAAYAHPTVVITEAASGISRDSGLVPAVDAGIVELDGQRIRFSHPLLATGVLEAAAFQLRAEVHARLADLLEDPEARGWQLAASVDRPDEAVAAALENAAEHARLRGALRPAALLLDRAGELTPPVSVDEAHRRTIEAAHLHFESGDAGRAETRLRELLDSLGPGVLRGRALWMLARIRTYEAPLEAADLFLQVLAEAQDDLELQAIAHEGVASSYFYAFEQLAEVRAHTEAGLALARELNDTRLVGDLLISKLGNERLLGDPQADVTATEVLELQAVATDRRVLDQPLLAVAESWLWTDSFGAARDGFITLLSRAEEIGDESGRPYVLSLMGQAECALGELHRGLAYGQEGESAAVQSGQPLFAAYNAAWQCVAEAQLGLVDPAYDSARRALEIVPAEIVKLVSASGLGHVELARGAPEDVVRVLAPALAFVRHEALCEPSFLRFVVDLVEALVELARLDEALELLDWYESNARRLERVSALANCARCRGLLAAQAGDLDAAMAMFDEALERHAQVELPLDRGRTLLALGVTQRRLKRRREARETLEAALAVFDGIGAALWADRARAELKRISGRAANTGSLTPAEERVATLVAEGKTNKEVAAALFLSDRTVEGHLAHIFGKLGIRGRGEIRTALAMRQDIGDGPSKHG